MVSFETMQVALVAQLNDELADQIQLCTVRLHRITASAHTQHRAMSHPGTHIQQCAGPPRHTHSTEQCHTQALIYSNVTPRHIHRQTTQRSSCAQSDSTALLHRHTHSTEQCHTQALIYSNVTPWHTHRQTTQLCAQSDSPALLHHSPLTVVLIATAAAIYSLEHGLCTFTAVLRSTQPSTLRGTVESAYGLSNNNNGDGGRGS